MTIEQYPYPVQRLERKETNYTPEKLRLNLDDVATSMVGGVFSGVFAAFIIATLALIFEFSGLWALLVFAIVAFGGYTHFMRTATALLWQVEEITEMDIDNDGWIGEPEPEPEPIRIIAQPAPQPIFVHHRPDPESSTTIRPFQFEMPQNLVDILPALAIAILVNERVFSRPDLAMGDAKIMSDFSFRKLSKLFIDNGLAEKINTSTELTAEGYELLRKYLPEEID